MKEYGVKIGADGIDTDALVKEIKERAAARVKNGEFDGDTISRAERFNLSAIKDNDEFFDLYLTSISSITQVDIGDFEIVEHRSSVFAPFLIRLKKTIWSLLRFYTYRLWSQQNRANNLVYSAFVLQTQRHRDQMAKLQEQIEALEKRITQLEGGQK